MRLNVDAFIFFIIFYAVECLTSHKRIIIKIDFYDEYKTTTKENGKHPLGKNKFSTRLKNLGFIQMSKTIHSKTAKGYLIKPL